MKQLDVKQNILAANQQAASRLRQGFGVEGTLVVNLISSPGSGKTSLLEATAQRLSKRLRMAALVGDIATERDAERLRRMGIPARQILTGGACHLDARLIDRELNETSLSGLDVLLIENVGNLICPTSYDLGEDFKIALLSVTEGDDKPFKYPGIFSRSSVVVITKSDLLPHVDFDLEAVRNQVASLNPQAVLLVTSVRSGEGLEQWCALIEKKAAAKSGVRS